MGHDELTTHICLQQQGRHPMGTQRTVSIYGLRLADNTPSWLLEEDPGHCLNNGTVGLFRAGAYDKHMTFLAIRWTEVPPGEYTFHSGERPNASKFERDRWNDDLRAVCDRLGLEIVEGPGWFTIPSEG